MHMGVNSKAGAVHKCGYVLIHKGSERFKYCQLAGSARGLVSKTLLYVGYL